MATYFRMPGVSADSDEAVLDSWAVEPGTTVSHGQTIAVVETEKAMVDVESDVDGTVHTLLVEAGITVPVGDPIAVLLGPGEAEAEAEKLLAALGRGDPAGSDGTITPTFPAPAPAPAASASGPAPTPATNGLTAAPATNGLAAAPAGGRRFSSPSARRRARELGVDIETVTGTGPRGRIIQADVDAAAAAPPTSAVSGGDQTSVRPAADPAVLPGWTAIPHSPLRRLVAARMQESKRTAPHFYLRASIRVDPLLALRQQVNAGRTERISVNDFVVKAAAGALLDVPEMNVVWTDEAVLQAPTADVAVAVAAERGLVTPVITDVGSLSLSALSARIRDAVTRANQGRLKQAELEGGTLTVSNLGMYGVEEFDAILNPPHAGILAVGAAVRKPVVGEGDSIEIATVMSVVLSVDHRPVDGAVGARWLARLKELLENPLALLV